MNLFIVCWSFLYRLTVFSQSFFFRKWSNIFLLGLLTAFLEGFTYFDGWLLRPNERTDEEYRDILFNLTGRPIEDVGYIGGSFMVGWRRRIKKQECFPHPGNRTPDVPLGRATLPLHHLANCGSAKKLPFSVR